MGLLNELALLDYTPHPLPEIPSPVREYSKQEKQLWRTPNTPEQPILKLTSEVFGGRIDLDPCSDPLYSVPAVNHLTEEDDCLTSYWGDKGCSVFMNPPFGSPHLFLHKLTEALLDPNGEVTQAIALLKIGTLGNQKSGPLIRDNASCGIIWGAGRINPVTGKPMRRLRFVDPDGVIVNQVAMDCILLYFGPYQADFLEVFAPWGTPFHFN